jgi:hypothetical protein
VIHSRPGFAPRSTDKTPAKLNDDMVPALHRKRPKETNLGPILDARAEMANLAKKHPAPDLLVNTTPSEPPHVLTPGK